MRRHATLLAALASFAPLAAHAEPTKRTARKKPSIAAKAARMSTTEALVTATLGGSFLFFGLGALFQGTTEAQTTKPAPSRPAPSR